MGTQRIGPATLAVLPLLAAACQGDPPPYDQVWERTVSRVTVGSLYHVAPSGHVEQHERPFLKDAYGRYVHFHGVNLSGSTKFPPTEVFDPEKHVLKIGDTTSYVGKPFALDASDDYTGRNQSADDHFRRLQELGFNAVRLLINWEALQHAGPWTIDTDYLDYLESVVDKAAQYGIYVLVDMHQDMFSRHLYVRYNKDPVDENGKPYPRGSLEAAIMALVPPYNDWVRGDGAPRWVVETCLPEKAPFMDQPTWGTPRLLGGLGPDQMLALLNLFGLLYPEGDGAPEIPAWLEPFFAALPEPFGVRESTDFMPWTLWGINGVTSLDVQRCFATFFAGDRIYPEYKVEGMGVGEYLQRNYTEAWIEVAKRMKGRTNVIGYDVMNEPVAFFLPLAVVGLYFQTGAADSGAALLQSVLGSKLGQYLFTVLSGVGMLPPDATEETKQEWGFAGADAAAMLGLNYGFDANYLQPLYERVGKAVQEVDPDAIIWFEGGMGMDMLLGGLPQWQVNMTRPQGVKQVVYAAHWYPDIYPFFGINQPPREFSPTEWRYRSFVPELEKALDRSASYLGNVPVVLGEFGTYYNFNGIDDARESGYAVSTQILDAFYRSLEELNMSHLQWCYSPENTYEYGDGWDLEDFSVVDPNLEPRGHLAFVRPYARATSGKKLASWFNSPVEYLDQEKGKPHPVGRFHLEMASKETDAPTEIFVPARHYPAGFYVTISDGVCYYDHGRQMLYWYPSNDAPDAVHVIDIEGPRPGVDCSGWDYLFKGESVLDKSGGIR